MTLYELGGEYQELLSLIDNGEIPEEAIADTLEAIQGELKDKMDNIACVIKNLKAESEAIKAEAKSLTERSKAKEKRADWLKKYLSAIMQQSGIDKVETERNIIKFGKSSSVEISDGFIEWAKEHSEDLLRTTVEVEADKVALKAAIQNGSVPEDLAKIVEKKNIQIK